MAYFPTVILSLALVFCTYLLVMLFIIRKSHDSWAWHFIFFGLTLLWVETVQALHLVWGVALPIEETLFCITILLKSLSYAIGFTIWKFVDLRRLKKRKPVDRTAPPD